MPPKSKAKLGAPNPPRRPKRSFVGPTKHTATRNLTPPQGSKKQVGSTAGPIELSYDNDSPMPDLDQAIDPDETEDELDFDKTDDENSGDYGSDYLSGVGIDEPASEAESDIETEWDSEEDIRPPKRVKMTVPKVAANSKASSILPKAAKPEPIAEPKPVPEPKSAAKVKSAAKPKPVAKAKGKPANIEDSEEQHEYNIDTEDDLNRHKVTSDTSKKFDFTPGYDDTLTPLSDLTGIYGHLARSLVAHGFESFAKKSDGRPLKVGTFCSGTEAPILAMVLLKKVFATLGITFNFEQLISAEIHPAKAAFIERNFDCPLIARDITEFITQRLDGDDEWNVTTAYGGRAKVPGDLDVLIAGFACDDFSPLNSRQKGMDDKGESGDTFYAIRAYVEKFKPKMVILENVSGAPWLDAKLKTRKKKNKEVKGIDKLFEEMDYMVNFMRVDTKDHYLPHTRVRGYMICILVEAYEGGETTLMEDILKFSDLFKSLKRKASVPIEALLLDFDSPLLENPPREDSLGKKRAATQWEKCKLGHQEYVLKHNLGNKHPVTNWESNGKRVYPDFYKVTAGMTDRVSDTVDIGHKRNVRYKRIDDRFYGRTLELSQNVYRVEDTTKNGIIGCVTPTNMLFPTMRGGRVTGIEALTAQGYDPNAVDISNMPESLLHDLSGNAMTSTVVGTVLFAALIHFGKVFNFEGRARQRETPEPNSNYVGEEFLISKESHPSVYEPVPVDSLTALAKSTRRLCNCEGRTRMAIQEFQRCRICKTISCAKCGQNPEHDYEPFHPERESPIVFADAIKHSLPFQIGLGALHSPTTIALLRDLPALKPEGFTNESWENAVTKIENSLQSTVFFRSSRRAESWEIVYDSPETLLKLEVSDAGAEWLLYANVPTEPFRSATGKLFRQYPIARMRPTGSDLMKGLWQLWIPQKQVFNTTIVSSGKLKPSFENERGLTDYSNHFVYSNLAIGTESCDENLIKKYFDQDWRGDYIQSSICGQAFDSVHCKQIRGGEKPLLLFFHHHLHSGNPDDHYFSFSNDVARKRYGEKLAVIANIHHEWRQPIVTAAEDKSLGFLVEGVPIADYSGSHTDSTYVTAEGYWASLPHHDLDLAQSYDVHYKHIPENISHVQSSCGHKRAVLEIAAYLLCKASPEWHPNRWILVNKGNQTAAWKEFLFLVEKQLVLSGHCDADKSWTKYFDDVSECSSCAPPLPHMLWHFNKKGTKQVPMEDPEMAAVYERAVKSRPSPIEVMFRVDANNFFEMKIGFDPATLVHQARARLENTGKSSSKGVYVGHGVESVYRLVTDDGKTVQHTLGDFVLRNTDDVVPDPEISKPNSPFTRKTAKGQRPAELKPQQAKALTWMLNQEKKGQKFTEQEIVEDYVENIGYRVEGKATRDIHVAGGILAQAVGFGKTILILSIILRHLDLLKDKAALDIAGAIATQATLILVPPHLVDQWEGEVKKFMGVLFKEKGKVIIVKTMNKLNDLTVRDIKNAAIVIASWDVCSSPKYTSALASFAAMPELDDKASLRAKREWYEAALRNVDTNIDELRNPEFKNSLASFVPILKATYDSRAQEAHQRVAYIPSKHLVGRKYVNAEEKHASSKEGPATGTKRKSRCNEESDDECEEETDKESNENVDKKINKKITETPPPPKYECMFNLVRLRKGKTSIEDMDHPLFEFFKWGRVVIDEHTYAKLESGLIFEYIKSHYIWILSGTPRLGNFHDVKTMATLLGLNLGLDDYSSMKSDLFKQKTSDLTESELFALYQQSPSQAWQRSRWEHAQRFLDMFMRQDFVDVSDIKCNEHVIAIKQSASEFAMYMELTDHVLANDFKNKPTRSTGDNKAKQIKEVTAGSDDGKIALFLRASSFGIVKNGEDDDEEISATNAPMMCEKVAALRAAEYAEKLLEFQFEFKKAHWLSVQAQSNNEPCPQFKGWRERAHNNHYGDHTTSQDIERAIREVESRYKFKDWELFYRTSDDRDVSRSHLPLYPEGKTETHGKTHLSCVVAALRSSTSQLNRICEQLAIRTRSLRVFQSVRSIQQGIVMSCSACGQQPATGGLTLLSQCGHVICSRCKVSSVCGVIEQGDMCKATVADHQCIPCASLGVQTVSDVSSNYGSKMDYIVDLIQNKVADHKIKDDEKVLVFVQHEQTQQKLMEALWAAGISYTTLNYKNGASTNLKQFQNASGRMAFIKVLIMNTGDESAAGSNLTVARHMIFVQPLYTTGSSARQEYEAAMTQAIGRSRRHNQKSIVEVYELVTTNTIEVDYREFRGRCTLQRQSPSSNELVQVPRPASSNVNGPLASSIAHAIPFDG